jgi:hypothetical protein
MVKGKNVYDSNLSNQMAVQQRILAYRKREHSLRAGALSPNVHQEEL